jgi:acetyl esterase/lipase
MNNFHRTIVALALLPALLCGCIARLPSSVKSDRNITYAVVGNQSLKLDIYEPQNPQGRLPVVVWIHGGAWKSGSKDPCPIGFMAAQNLAIVSIDYRLSTIAPFPAQIYDCKGVIRWLRAHANEYDLDSNHICIFGPSAGGQLALFLADTPDNPKLEGDVGGNLNFSSRVQCVCAFYPPTELNRLVSDPATRNDPNGDVARLIGGAVAQNVDKAIAASPLTYVSRDCAPVFLMHGGADTLVPPDQSVLFYGALRKAGVDARLEIIPGEGHGIIAPPDVAKEILHFTGKYLHAGPTNSPALSRSTR